VTQRTLIMLTAIAEAILLIAASSLIALTVMKNKISG
jgi:hypothetical protein